MTLRAVHAICCVTCKDVICCAVLPLQPCTTWTPCSAAGRAPPRWRHSWQRWASRARCLCRWGRWGLGVPGGVPWEQCLFFVPFRAAPRKSTQLQIHPIYLPCLCHLALQSMLIFKQPFVGGEVVPHQVRGNLDCPCWQLLPSGAAVSASWRQSCLLLLPRPGPPILVPSAARAQLSSAQLSSAQLSSPCTAPGLCLPGNRAVLVCGHLAGTGGCQPHQRLPLGAAW